MILLPRGNPVKEKIDPGKLNLPDALNKLRDGNFSGYLRFDATGGTGILIFENGRLISGLYEELLGRTIAYDAIARVFEVALAGSVTLDIFRLSPELALSIHALLHGKILYKGQELKLIDIKALLLKLKEDRISGCLRIYTDEHVALIFYRDGSPLGFFHDGSTDLETTADTSMSVARLPGAKIDVLTTSAAEETVLADLMASADITTLWNREMEKIAVRRREAEQVQSRNQEASEKLRREKLAMLFRATAEKQIGKFGISLVDKEFEKVTSLDEAGLSAFFANLSKAAKLVAGPSKIELMLDEMKKGARNALKS